LIRFSIAALLVFLTFQTVQADKNRPAYLELRQTSDTVYDVLWTVPARDQSQRFGIYVEFSDDVDAIVPATSSYVANAFIERWKISHKGGLTGARITIRGLERVSTDVLVRIERLDGSSETKRLNAALASFQVKGSAQFWEVLKTYLVFGIEHILGGSDHLLFVACLIFIAGTWRRILLTISGFTVAHSITGSA